MIFTLFAHPLWPPFLPHPMITNLREAVVLQELMHITMLLRNLEISPIKKGEANGLDNWTKFDVLLRAYAVDRRKEGRGRTLLPLSAQKHQLAQSLGRTADCFLLDLLIMRISTHTFPSISTHFHASLEEAQGKQNAVQGTSTSNNLYRLKTCGQIIFPSATKREISISPKHMCSQLDTLLSG